MSAVIPRASSPTWGTCPSRQAPRWIQTDAAVDRRELDRFFYCNHWCCIGLG